MAKSNGKTEDVYDENVVVVPAPTALPYSYIPYSSVSEARAAAAWDNRLDPNKTLYVYEAEAPAGYKIVAYPILMEKPEETDDDQS
jgi:hypothetical protein